MEQLMNDAHTGGHEATPLLPSSTEQRKSSTKSISPHRTRCTWPWIYVVALCGAIILIADVGEYLVLAPRIRLFESIVCTKYWLREDPSLVGENGTVPERLCKVDEVQDTLATILGWQQFFDSIPAILLPIPYGYLADKYGRKWILVSALIGLVLSWSSVLFMVGVLNLPLQFVWLSSIFSVIGGGSTVAGALIFTIAADVTPADKRSSAFFYLVTSELIDECLVPPITAILMSKSNWIPLISGVAMVVVCTVISLALPETLPIPELAASAAPSTAELVPRIGHEKGGKWTDWLGRTWKSFAFATRNASVAALILTFLVSMVGRQSFNLLLQYVSKKYAWSLSNAGLLSSLRAAVNAVLFMIVLPSVSNLTLFNKTAMSKDLWLARVSIILMILGSCILAVSATSVGMIIGIVLYTLGTGFPIVLRSLVTTMVEAQNHNETSDIARLYSLISLMEGLGSLISGPGMAWAFRLGIKLGEAWLGLPFALAAVLFILVSPVVFILRV